VAITASGRLSLQGPVFGSTLTGHANVTSGVLYFADLVQKRIVNLDELADTSLAALIQQQRLGPEFENVFLDSLRIQDLELEMGSDVWLRSDEANIQLAGSVRLTKQRNQYLVSGTLQAVRGTYRLKVGPVSREFVVSEGTVRYFGTPDQDAALDIKPSTSCNPVGQPEGTSRWWRISGGTLLVPKVTLEAEKYDLSQTEIIALTLFGKRIVELGGDQGIANQGRCGAERPGDPVGRNRADHRVGRRAGGLRRDPSRRAGGQGVAVVPWNVAVGAASSVPRRSWW